MLWMVTYMIHDTWMVTYMRAPYHVGNRIM
jgi:hypothetical protein